MSELQSCKRCGKIFQFNGFISVCPECKERDDTDYDKIRTYLFEHPLAKIFEVSNELNIPVGRIKRFLREDRLEIVEKNNLFLRCELCGSPIQSGQYCDECAKQLKHDFKAGYIGSFGTKQESGKLSFLTHNGYGTRKFAVR